jgi:hypothetical protein
LTNGVFPETELDLTTGTKYHAGSGSENQINGSGSWTFHENSLFRSFEGEVENGKMKDGTLFSKEISTIKSIQPLLKSMKGVITEGGLAQAIEEGNGADDKIGWIIFTHSGEWKNNKQHGYGKFHIRACICVPSIQIGNFDFVHVGRDPECLEKIEGGLNVIKLFSPSLV